MITKEMEAQMNGTSATESPTIFSDASDINKFKDEQNKFNANRNPLNERWDIAKKQENKVEPSKEDTQPKNKPQEDHPKSTDENQDGDTEPKEDGENNLSMYEKRLRDKDKYITETRQELKRAEKEAQRYKELVARFNDKVEYDEDGLPVRWKLDSASDIKPVKEPTDEELEELSPRQAYRRQKEYDDYISSLKARKQQELSRKQELEEQKLKQQQEKLQAEFDKAYVNTVKVYPDLSNPASELSIKVTELYQEHPYLQYSPSSVALLTKQAAIELGIPKAGDKKKEIQPKPRNNNTNYITNIGNTGKSTPKTLENDDPLAKWMEKNKRFQTNY